MFELNLCRIKLEQGIESEKLFDMVKIKGEAPMLGIFQSFEVMATATAISTPPKNDLGLIIKQGAYQTLGLKIYDTE